MKKTTSMSQSAVLAGFGFAPDLRVVLVLGGSQGAEAINRHIARNIEWYASREELGLLWQCGEQHLSKYQQYNSRANGIRVTGFIEQMARAYTACSVIVARAGALTISELALAEKPAILVPLPTAAGNHQLYNARSYAAYGGAEVIEESELSWGRLEATLGEILENRELYNRMAAGAGKAATPGATGKIVENIMELAGWSAHVSEV